jgi:hypothetical protein
LPPIGQQWRMIMLFIPERKLNWRRAKLRQKTCIDESIMLPSLAALKIVYWQSVRGAQ